MSDTFTIYGRGLCYCSVCTNLSDETATSRLNLVNPTGIDSGWRIADEPFSNGDPNGRPCEDTTGCRHLLFSC